MQAEACQSPDPNRMAHRDRLLHCTDVAAGRQVSFAPQGAGRMQIHPFHALDELGIDVLGKEEGMAASELRANHPFAGVPNRRG
ncbi:MAG: hypothetical protein WBG92_17435 [Thiohalocapsa sp.]